MKKLWFFGDSFTDNDFNRLKFRKEYDDYIVK
jgi:hypothetical protein